MIDEPSSRADAKLQPLAEQDEQFAEEMWLLRNPTKGGKKMTFEAIRLEVPLRCGFTISLSQLHAFYRWLKVRRDFQQKRRDIAQLKAELARDPDISEEQIEKAGRVMFMADGMVTNNPKIFASMVMIGHDKVKLQQNEKRLEQADKSLGIDERKMQILERKVSEAKDVTDNGTMTAEEKQLRMKEIFGS